MFCHKCGAELRIDAGYCSRCGAAVFKENPHEDHKAYGSARITENKGKSGRKTGMIPAAVSLVFVICVACVIAVMVFNRDNRENPAGTQSAEENSNDNDVTDKNPDGEEYASNNLINKELDTGNALLDGKDYEQALKAFEGALRMDEKCAGAYVGIIRAYGGSDNYEGVADTFEVAKQKVNESERGLIEEAVLEQVVAIIDSKVEQAEYDKAKELLEHACTLSLDEPAQDGFSAFYNDTTERIRQELLTEITADELPPGFEAFMIDFLTVFNLGLDLPEEGPAFDCLAAADAKWNILSSIVQHPTCVDFERYPVRGVREYWGDTDVPARLREWGSTMPSYATFDRDSVDWIAKNVFHLSDDDIRSLVVRAEAEHVFYLEGDNYIRAIGGLGLPGSKIKIRSVMYDGERYYIDYDWFRIYADDIEQKGSYQCTFSAVCGYETTDGTEYWSLYKHGKKTGESLSGSEGACHPKEMIMDMRGLNYGSFCDQYRIEAQLLHNNQFGAEIPGTQLYVIIAATKYDQNTMMSYLTAEDSNIRISGRLGDIFDGTEGAYEPETFAALLQRPGGVEPYFDMREGAGTAYYVGNRYCVIGFDTNDDDRYDMEVAISLDSDNYVTDSSYAWLYVNELPDL